MQNLWNLRHYIQYFFNAILHLYNTNQSRDPYLCKEERDKKLFGYFLFRTNVQIYKLNTKDYGRFR